MIEIENYLSTERFISKQEIADRSGLSERNVRRKISDLKLKRPVIFNSKTKGYRLAKHLDEMSKEEIIEEMELIQYSANEINSRVKVLNQQLRSYIAYLKVAEKFLM
jgi:biotin operon repressor